VIRREQDDIVSLHALEREAGAGTAKRRSGLASPRMRKADRKRLGGGMERKGWATSAAEPPGWFC
jgi:hypothetical protein